MERSSTSQPRQDQEHSTGELVKMMSEQVSVLIRDELKLARLEMAGKGKQAALGAGMFGAWWWRPAGPRVHSARD